MKQTTFLASVVFAILGFSIAGCRDATLTMGDGSEVVKATGKIATEERKIPEFNKISLEGVFNVYLIQKENEAIRIQADESVLPYILTEVKDNVLTVKMKDDSKYVKVGNISVYITLKDIHELETKGVGLLHSMNTLKLDSLGLKLKGVGASKLDLQCNTLNVQSELVGSLTLSGSANEFTVNHKGIGAFKAFDFKAKSVRMESDGIGKAEVYASEKLFIDAKGLGGVVYKGDPAMKDIRNEGVGVVASSN